MKTVTIKKDEELLVTLFIPSVANAYGVFSKELSIVYQIVPRPLEGIDGKILGYILDVSLLKPDNHSSDVLNRRIKYLMSIQLGIGSIEVLGAPNVCSTQT
jgi:hypothetical protein